MKVSPQSVIAVSLAILLTALIHPRSSGQTRPQQDRSLMISSTLGRDLFEFYCASCHGRDGKGGGPGAAALKVPPPDLTTIARRNGGVFPRSRIEAFVTGDEDRLPPAHGSKEMPIWGPIFRALDPNDRMNRVRIANIVEYIESIQAAQ